MTKKDYIGFIVYSLLILLIGLSVGHSLGYVYAQGRSFPHIKTVEDVNMGTATVKLLEYKNGHITGFVDGQTVRIAYNTEAIEDFPPGSEFSIPVNEISLSSYYSPENTAEDVHYIASKQGKYYYSVLDSRAHRITPKNRYYFKSEAEAVDAGFKPYN